MASTITTAVVTGGSNSHATTVAEINATRSDFGNPGVTGVISANIGSGGTGSFCVNADASPDMGITLVAGSAYIKATPSGQTSQLLRANMASNYTSYTISANSSGSTKYDWIYLSVDPTKANNPASDASDVTSVYTSRSTSNTTDNGSPPTYGLLLAIVTVANGASSITNSNITDKRVNASWTTVQTNTYFFDFVESGCVWSGDSYGATLNASMTSGVVWIAGQRLTVSAVSARAFTASKDTYVDLSNNGDGTAAFTYTAVNNNTASPALASGAIRIGIIVSGASSIAAATSVNQGQETMILPIASSIPYAVTDSLGNLICPRDPNRKTLGYRQIIGNITVASSTPTQAPGLSCPVILPLGRKIRVTSYCFAISNSVADVDCYLSIWDGVVNSGTNLNEFATISHTASFGQGANVSQPTTPSSSSKTYNVGFRTGANTCTMNASSTKPTYILVELA